MHTEINTTTGAAKGINIRSMNSTESSTLCSAYMH